MITRIAKSVLITFALLFISLHAYGETAELSAKDAGGCRLIAEADEKWGTLRLRVRQTGPAACNITQQDIITILDDVFARDKELPGGVEYKSLFLGRIIDYPWLSQYLAASAKDNRNWLLQKGRTRTGDINAFVKSLLSNDNVLGIFREQFNKTGYDVIGVSVEKVLVGKYTDIPRYEGDGFKGKVPFDAMMWVVLKRR